MFTYSLPIWEFGEGRQGKLKREHEGNVARGGLLSLHGAGTGPAVTQSTPFILVVWNDPF